MMDLQRMPKDVMEHIYCVTKHTPKESSNTYTFVLAFS